MALRKAGSSLSLILEALEHFQSYRMAIISVTFKQSLIASTMFTISDLNSQLVLNQSLLCKATLSTSILP